MPARNTQPVRYLLDEDATPPRRQEVVTTSPNALAFWMGGTYHADRPDHGDGALLTGTWAVIPHHAPANVQPVFVYYDRAQSPPFEVGGQRYAQLGDAMEAALDPAPEWVILETMYRDQARATTYETMTDTQASARIRQEAGDPDIAGWATSRADQP
jgi:hypothetical protein